MSESKLTARQRELWRRGATLCVEPLLGRRWVSHDALNAAGFNARTADALVEAGLWWANYPLLPDDTPRFWCPTPNEYRPGSDVKHA